MLSTDCAAVAICESAWGSTCSKFRKQGSVGTGAAKADAPYPLVRLPVGLLARELGQGEQANGSRSLFGNRENAPIHAHQVFLLRDRNS
jgi:hypothetical protein